MARLNTACGHRAIRIDHIGSTAVPGLDAKDVIDIQVTVDSLDIADELADALLTAGYPRVTAITDDVPKPDGRSAVAAFDHTDDPTFWHKRFHASADPGRPTNVHLRVDGWPNQQFPLLFTDWLIANPGVQADYLAAKRAAEAQGHPDTGSYADAEGTVVPRRVPAGVGVGVRDGLGASADGSASRPGRRPAGSPERCCRHSRGRPRR